MREQNCAIELLLLLAGTLKYNESNACATFNDCKRKLKSALVQAYYSITISTRNAVHENSRETWLHNVSR